MSTISDRPIVEFSASRFEVSCVTDTIVLLSDVPGALNSLSASVENVLLAVNRLVKNGLGRRQVFFRSLQGHWQRIDHQGVEFSGFSAVGRDQARFFERMIQVQEIA